MGIKKLTTHQNQRRIVVVITNLYKETRQDSLNRIVPEDETWDHYYQHESKYHKPMRRRQTEGRDFNLYQREPSCFIMKGQINLLKDILNVLGKAKRKKLLSFIIFFFFPIPRNYSPHFSPFLNNIETNRVLTKSLLSTIQK